MPYTLCTNDSKFAPGRAFSTADDFFNFTRAAVDTLLEEARESGCGKMLSVGLHSRLIGHPARIGGLHRLLDYLAGLGPAQVWIAQRAQIARHWQIHHPPPTAPHLAVAPAPPRPLPEAAAELSSESGLASGPRLLITGGCGFVLCHVVQQWLALPTVS